MEVKRIFYTFQEAQEFLNVRRDTIYKLVARGLPSHKIGRRKNMGEKPPYDDPSITHGICDECLPKVLKSACKPAQAPPEFRSNLLERLKRKVEAK